MQRFPRRWDKKTCIDFLQRKIIINAIAYYELDSNLIPDREYDELSKQLVGLQQGFDVSSTQYGYIMYDFDGTTGFDLYHRLNDTDRSYLYGIAFRACGKHAPAKVVKKKGGLF